MTDLNWGWAPTEDRWLRRHGDDAEFIESQAQLIAEALR